MKQKGDTWVTSTGETVPIRFIKDEDKVKETSVQRVLAKAEVAQKHLVSLKEMLIKEFDKFKRELTEGQKFQTVYCFDRTVKMVFDSSIEGKTNYRIYYLKHVPQMLDGHVEESYQWKLLTLDLNSIDIEIEKSELEHRKINKETAQEATREGKEKGAGDDSQIIPQGDHNSFGPERPGEDSEIFVISRQGPVAKSHVTDEGDHSDESAEDKQSDGDESAEPVHQGVAGDELPISNNFPDNQEPERGD